LDKKSCVKIPEHAHAAKTPKDVWLCDSGYKEENNSCVQIETPVTQLSIPNPPPPKTETPQKQTKKSWIKNSLRSIIKK
jgi:hypothetical protein